MSNLFLDSVREHLAVVGELPRLQEDLEAIIALICGSIQTGGKLLLCGNGGSAADCQHIAAEFTGRFIQDRAPLPALALTTDTSALTAIGNDYSFSRVFERQVVALGRPNDVLLAVSTSGDSENVILAVEAANRLGLSTAGLLGRDGGRLRLLCNQSVVVPSQSTARIQEAHILIGHVICGNVERRLRLVS